jgi:hypothetical protein
MENFTNKVILPLGEGDVNKPYIQSSHYFLRWQVMVEDFAYPVNTLLEYCFPAYRGTVFVSLKFKHLPLIRSPWGM